MLSGKLKDELEKVTNFWLNYSLDEPFGGYFNCLDGKGIVYDNTKYVWLQARQVWMLSLLVETGHLDREIGFKAAKLGAEFLKSNAIFKHNGLWRAYFSLSREGSPISSQRKIFSECFIVLAFLAYSQLSDSKIYEHLAFEILDSVLEYYRQPRLLGRPIYKGTAELLPLDAPMIILSLLDEVGRRYPNKMSPRLNAVWDQCTRDILLHVDLGNRCVRENVLPNGMFDDATAIGRRVNPGHAIEAGWFLHESALLMSGRDDRRREMLKRARQMIEWSFDLGWDSKSSGGITYFIDSCGKPRTELEANQKLWWPVCEALVAFASLYRGSPEFPGRPEDVQKFEMVLNYALRHFSDEFGGWWGYLNPDSTLNLEFKGGPYKGFFHVPRCLLMCHELLKKVKRNML